MGERKMYKTKLCVLYEKGRCNRPNCSFAHGNADLRRSLSSYTHIRDNRGVDLRNKLDRRVSPRRMHSPARNSSGHHNFRGFSPTTSLEKNGGRKSRKRQEFEGQSDLSGSFKISDDAEDQIKRSTYHDDSRIVLKEQLREMQSNIDILDHRKSQLKTLVEGKDEEIQRLTSRIQELEAQLIKEKEESNRTISKLKKFVKAHKRFLHAQEEFKRSQVQLHKLGDQLGCISTTYGGDEEDSSLNIVSDSEAHCTISPHNNALDKSPSKKNLGVRHGTADKSTQGNGEVKAVDHKIADQPVQDGCRQKRRKTMSLGDFFVNKGSGPALVLPSTSMAANAADRPVDVEVEEIVEIVETVSAGNDKKTRTHERKMPFSVPPPLPVFRDSYTQYKGEDEYVDIEGLEEDMVEVDIV